MTSSPPSPLRLLPTGAIVVGRESHPLKIGAFPRRTAEGKLGRGPVRPEQVQLLYAGSPLRGEASRGKR